MGSGTSRPPSRIQSESTDNRDRSTARSRSPVRNKDDKQRQNVGDKSKEKDRPTTRESTKEDSKGIDIMISYSHSDKDVMTKIRAAFVEHGFSVWVDVTGLQAGVDFLSKIGQAIIDAKVFVQLESEKSIQSKYCQDELALAYISNKPIFPVALQPPETLFPSMDTGMKLQLARFNWNLFTDEDAFEQNLDTLCTRIQSFLSGGKLKTAAEEEEKGAKGTDPENKRKNLQRQSSRVRVNRHFSQEAMGKNVSKFQQLESLVSMETVDFWKTHFKNKEQVAWSSFETAFYKQYQKVLDVVFTKADQDWLLKILNRELSLENDEDTVTHDSFSSFCTVDDTEMPFWERVQDQAIESYTMKEVFDMESSVRVEAIENLGKFRSKAVVEALLDLLRDKDNNIRAVAAISLARTGQDDKGTIKQLMKCLNDKDRLVRESACLALGHLKAQEAVPKILHLWRNDFISHVREAAQVALEQIGGEEANKAMLITRVLSEEIRMLTQDDH